METTSKKEVVHFKLLHFSFFTKKKITKSLHVYKYIWIPDVPHGSFIRYFNLYFSGIIIFPIDNNLSHRARQIDFFKQKIKSEMVTHTCNPRSWEVAQRITVSKSACVVAKTLSLSKQAKEQKKISKRPIFLSTMFWTSYFS